MAPAPSTRTALWGECGTSAHLRTLSHCSDQAPRWVRTRERYWRTRRSDISPVRLEGRRDRRARSPGTRRQTAGRRHAVRTSRRMPYRRPQGLPRPSHRPHALPPGTNKSRLRLQPRSETDDGAQTHTPQTTVRGVPPRCHHHTHTTVHARINEELLNVPERAVKPTSRTPPRRGLAARPY